MLFLFRVILAHYFCVPLFPVQLIKFNQIKCKGSTVTVKTVKPRLN